MKCTLCNSETDYYTIIKNIEYFKCKSCLSVFMNPDNRLCAQAEFDRYLKHQNLVTDAGYQSFTQPLVDTILQYFGNNATGLDYGSGEYSAVTHNLTKYGYNIKMFDPFFHNNLALLDDKYDFIVCCEVIEHFYNPHLEFSKLRNLLKENGKLFCMTHQIEDSTDFKNWYYKNDLTHVFFYNNKAFEYITVNFNFSSHKINNRIVIFNVKKTTKR
ncbi:MAG: class I SAM-dependent methyltransferase [Bacteroidales bacterium]|nr:class I SAM-dependent methyltransferase [Bacteroidales bacterium]